MMYVLGVPKVITFVILPSLQSHVFKIRWGGGVFVTCGLTIISSWLQMQHRDAELKTDFLC